MLPVLWYGRLCLLSCMSFKRESAFNIPGICNFLYLRVFWYFSNMTYDSYVLSFVFLLFITSISQFQMASLYRGWRFRLFVLGFSFRFGLVKKSIHAHKVSSLKRIVVKIINHSRRYHFVFQLLLVFVIQLFVLLSSFP